jgi:hypothetical protein
MGKILFWVVVVFVVLFALRLVNIGKSRARNASTGKPPEVPPAAAMVRCVECGVFLPRADARPVPAGFHCGTVNCAQHGSR